MTAAGVTMGPMAAKATPKDGARLWKALREMSDDQRAQLQWKLAQWRAVSGDDTPRVVVVDGAEWAPHALIKTLLAHLRELAHEQSHVEASSDQPAAVDASKKPEASQLAKAFALEADDFPTLGPKTKPTTATATLLPVKTTKRRITTTLIATDAPYAAVAVQPPSCSQSKDTVSGNNATSGAQSSNPWAKRDLLERRMAAALPPVQSVSEPSPVRTSVSADPIPKPPPPPATPELTHNPWMSPPPSMNRAERKPPSLTLMGRPKKGKRVSLLSASNQEDDSSPTTSPGGKQAVLPLPQEPVEANLQAARLYGSLIVQRLVPSICGELQFLTGLLHRASCATTSSSSNSSDKCSHANEFCRSDASSAFAAAAIETAEPTLVQLGSDMVQLVAKSLEDAKLCENLVSRLRVAVDMREERRVEESAKIGCELPVETTGTAFRDYALPFCEDMDSRLNYRSPTESIIYSNREKIRDAFLSQLRTFQKRQNSLQGSLDATQSNGASSASHDAQQLLQDVMHENQWWFARFFVLELVQIGSNPLGESDKDLVMKIMEDKMVVKNPDRLRKLHRRFSSQKTPDSIAGGVTTTGFANNRSKPNNQQQSRQHGGNANSKGDAKTRISPSNGSSNHNHSSQHSSSAGDNKASSNGANTDRSQFLDHMRGFFSDNQAFFFHFLVSCDSYQFAQLVKHQLEAQFMTIWRAKAKADPRKDFTETVLRLKVLAKFIGFLRFSPQWHWSALATALSSNNPALDVAQREAVATLEQSQSSNSFNVLSLLEESIESGAIAKCIPWLCDYLTMLSSDVLSSSTKYFHRVLTGLAYVHRSSILDNLGETGLYVAMQIEQVFHLLTIDDLLPHSLRWHHITDKSPAWMKPTAVDALLKHDKSKDQQVDGLPFLFSKMFVEVCVSELDDLRGFIQTRANPHHRKNTTAAGRRSGGDRTSTIRKVRPLQVVSEQQLEISTPAPGEESGEREGREVATSKDTKRGPSENPLRDAFFKLYPQLKQAVEFVVDMVVTNMCEYALNKYVKPNADALIDSCVEVARIQAPSFTQLILHEFQVQLDERLEDFMATTVSTALREATEQCETCVEAALRPLIAPSIPTQLITAATTIAQAQANAAITTLITRSLRTEFLKRIAQRKRSIVKEAGVAAAAAAASVGSAPAPGVLSDTDSVARALKFSFDESTDVHLSPLDEAMQSIKRNVVGMNNALQSSSPAGGSIDVRNKRMMASFTRFQRAFRDSLAEAVDELGDSTGEMDVVLWSWSWRAVRLWLKAFASLVTDADASQSSIATHLNDFVKELTKTLRVIAQLSAVVSGESTVSPFDKLCRFVMQSAISIPTINMQHEELPEATIDACATLLSETHELAPSPPTGDEWLDHTQTRGGAIMAVLARAFPVAEKRDLL